MTIAGKTVFAQFTEVRSIHRCFYKWKMKDNNNFFPQAFANPCTMYKPRRSRRGVHLTAFKGSHRMGDGWNFSKNLSASLFNDDLSHEPNFGRIHLAGQHWYI